MSKMQRCNECEKPVAGLPNLFLGDKNGRLCPECVVKLQMEHEAPTAISYFIPWYVKRIADQKKPTAAEELAELRTRVHYLESELGVNANEPAVSFATPGQVTPIRRNRRGRR